MGFGPSFRTFCFFFGVGEPNLSNNSPNSVSALSHPMASTVPFLWIGTCTDRFSKSGFPKLVFAKSVSQNIFSQNQFFHNLFFSQICFFKLVFLSPSQKKNHKIFFPRIIFFQQ